MLKIQNLHVSINQKEILKGIDLKIKPGELHVLTGPNGSGKTTLAMALLGHPFYKVKKESEIILDGKNITDLSPDKRARLGLFLAFQEPAEISGVSIVNFLREVWRTKVKNQPDSFAGFYLSLKEKAKVLNLSQGMLSRSLNEGFSGGEKKKIEALQLLFVQPKYAVIDEIDAGLDSNSLEMVAKIIKALKEKNSGILLITHYQTFFRYLKPDFIHLIKEGRISQ